MTNHTAQRWDVPAIVSSAAIVVGVVFALWAKYAGIIGNDYFTFTLIMLALTPFLGSTLTSLSNTLTSLSVGGKMLSLNFRVREQQAQIDQIQFLLSNFLHIEEIIWLKSIADRKKILAEPFGAYNPEEFLDLRRLVLSDLLAFKPGLTFSKMRESESATIDLTDYFTITDTGRKYLSLYEGMNPQGGKSVEGLQQIADRITA